jgi:phage shock protein A
MTDNQFYIDKLQARLDRAVTRGLEQVEYIATMEVDLKRLRSIAIERMDLFKQAAAKVEQAQARIEALEAVVREILEGHPDAFDLARTVLEPNE